MTLEKVQAFLATEQGDLDGAVELIERLVIAKAADLEVASNWLVEVAKTHDRFDAKRKEWTDPLNKVVKSINAAFKPALDSLKACESTIKGKIGDYHADQAARQRAAIAAAAEAVKIGDAGAAKAALIAASATVVDGGASVSTYWDGDVVDASQIPREYLVPDVAMLRAVTKARGCDPGIPGWAAREVQQVRTKRR